MTAETRVESTETIDIAALGAQIDAIVATNTTHTATVDGIAWRRFNLPKEGELSVGSEDSGRQWYEATVQLAASAFHFRWPADGQEPIRLTVKSFYDHEEEVKDEHLRCLAAKLPSLQEGSQRPPSVRHISPRQAARPGREASPLVRPSLKRRAAQLAIQFSQQVIGAASDVLGK